jgi:hypothetical protein
MFEATLDISQVRVHHLLQDFTLVAGGKCLRRDRRDGFSGDCRPCGCGFSGVVGDATIFPIIHR